MVRGSEWERIQRGTPTPTAVCMVIKRKEDAKVAICKCLKRKGTKSSDEGSTNEFQNGNYWYTPGSFRKSGKQRTYGIRNLEECVRRLNKKDLASRNCGSKGIAIAGEERT